MRVALQQHRNQIDRIDAHLLRLLNRRARLALQVGRLKKRRGLRVFDSTREQAILRRMSRANHGPLPAQAVRAIYQQILRAIRRLEQSA